MKQPDVLIVGAGITGLATAHALAEEGASVVVVDAYGPAAMASGWTLAGVRQSGRDPAELALARGAVALWADLDARLDAPTGNKIAALLLPSGVNSASPEQSTLWKNLN